MVITNSELPVTIAVGPMVDGEECQSFTVNVSLISNSLLKDANGAGDSFVGGFLAKLCKIHEDENVSNHLIFSSDQLIQCTQAGNLIASEVIQKYGCDFPSVAHLKARIEATL